MDMDRSPLWMLGMMAPITMIYALLAALFIPFVMYVIARWRSHRDAVSDPQLGIKVALHYFAVMAYQLLLAGSTLFLYTVVSTTRSEDKGEIYRLAFGFILPAAIVLFIHRALLQRTNDVMHTSVRRLFAGYNLLFTGLIAFFALVFAFEMMLKKGTAGDAGRAALAMVLVYCTAWALQGWSFAVNVLGGGPSGGGGMASPPSHMPQGGGTSVGGTSSGPSLPSLGGGAYPPIDPR